MGGGTTNSPSRRFLFLFFLGDDEFSKSSVLVWDDEFSKSSVLFFVFLRDDEFSKSSVLVFFFLGTTNSQSRRFLFFFSWGRRILKVVGSCFFFLGDDEFSKSSVSFPRRILSFLVMLGLELSHTFFTCNRFIGSVLYLLSIVFQIYYSNIHSVPWMFPLVLSHPKYHPITSTTLS